MVSILEAPKAQKAQTIGFDLDELNERMAQAHPREILAWCINNIHSGLMQSTAFGIGGMVIMDILYRELQPYPRVPVLFLDTLHHFAETLELVEKAKATYNLDLRVYKALEANNRKEFAARYGVALWHSNIEKFHHVTKVEPLERAMEELNAIAWITGRRRDQAVTRTEMPVFELDKNGRLKVNPLAHWTRKETWSYIFEHGVIYNPLLDQGYASIGDEPLTTPVLAGEDERAGRWRGSNKTECGIHI